VGERLKRLTGKYLVRLRTKRPLRGIGNRTCTDPGIPDRYAAAEALRIRKSLSDAELSIVGEAAPDFVDWLDVKDGEIFCVMAVS
jgi:hypothetical protein